MDVLHQINSLEMKKLGLRTKKTYEKYTKFRNEGFLANGCNLCKKNKPIKEYKHWRIINNKFPWDRIAKINHILIPKRHIVYGQLNEIEKKEFDLLKSTYVDKKYEIMVEATDGIKSIPSHYHVHLIVVKDKI